MFGAAKLKYVSWQGQFHYGNLVTTFLSLSTQPLRSRLPPPPPPPPRDQENSGSIQCVNGQEMNTLLDSYLTKEAKFRGVIASHKENVSSTLIFSVQKEIKCMMQ